MATTSFPTTEQLDIAIEWLRCNEGTGGEADHCKAVADYLEHLEVSRALRLTLASARRKRIAAAARRVA